MLIKYTCDSKSQTLRMRYPFQSTGRPISHRNGWSFRVYMTPLRHFVSEWNSRPGTRTGVNSRRGDSRRHSILWWEPEWTRSVAKVATVSCKHPLRPSPPHIRIFLNSQVFLSGYGFRPYVFGVSFIRIRNFLNLLSRVKIFEYAMNPKSCER